MIRLYIAGEELEAVVYTGRSASVVGKHLALAVKGWKRSRKVKVRQEDRSIVVGKLPVNTSSQVMDSSLVSSRFRIGTKVLEIGNRNVIFILSWLTKNGFSVDMRDRCLRNVNTGYIIPCSISSIASVLVMEEELVDDREMLLIIDAGKP